MQYLRIVAVSLALTVGAAAHAVTPQPGDTSPVGPWPDPNTVPGPVIGFVYDPASGATRAQWFGLSLNQIIPSELAPAAGLTLTFTLTDGNLTGSGLRYAVLASDRVGFGYDTSSIAFTSQAAGGIGLSMDSVDIMAASVQGYVVANGTGPANPIFGANTGSTVSFTRPGNSLGPLLGGNLLASQNATQTIGNALNFFYASPGSDLGDPFNAASVVRYGNGPSSFGSWNTAVSGNDIIFTWTMNALGGGTEIPLPAAGWLLLSALSGLGIVGRRRKAVAA